MSSNDEQHDLAEMVRGQRPKTEPLSPAFKRRLRAQLLEEAAMTQKQRGFNISHVATLLGGLAVLVIVPLIFWSMLNAQTAPDAFQPGAASASEGEVPENAAADSAEIAQIGIAESATNGTVEAPVTVSYSLASATEGTLYLTYSFPNEGGTFYGERLLPVTQDQNEAVITIDLPATAVQSDGMVKQEMEFAVELIIGDVSGILSSSGDADNYATLAHVGTAVSHSDDETVMELPVQIAYKLTDFEEAAVIVGYNDATDTNQLRLQPVPEIVEVTVDKNGNVLATESYTVDEAGNRVPTAENNDRTSLPITLGEGTLNVTILVPAELVNEAGSLNENVDIWVALELTEASE
jgi:hypothetical protein